MTVTQLFVARWGIIGCGWISSMFVKDLVLARPEITDVAHDIVAVGSRDKSKAADFIRDYCPKGAFGQDARDGSSAPEPFGSYPEVMNHSDVNIIYIGTLHPTHYADTKAALEAGKNVLVEKPACLNSAEWKSLSQIAKEKELFLMEGLWTRFQPAVKKLVEKLHVEKVIGDIKHVKADFSMSSYNFQPDTHRVLAQSAAGGPLLDLGPYILLPAIIALYDNPGNAHDRPTQSTSMTLSRNKVDLTTTISLDFPKLEAQAVCTTSHLYNSPKDERCVIIGTKGEIVINDGLSRITKFTIKEIDEAPSFWINKWKEPVVIEEAFEGFGLQWEADAVARSLRDGEKENSLHDHAETALMMEMLDEARKQGGYVLPKGMEQL